jgi:glycosyltransferase involved in cell wall biosynthesis
MKVLHVVPYFPPDRIGGVGEVVAHLHNSLLDGGHDSRVVTSGSTRSDPRVRRIGGSPARFALLAWLGWKETGGVDLIHAHHGEALLLLAAARLRRRRPRLLVTIHVDNRRVGRAFRPYSLEGRRIVPGWSGRLQRFVLAPLKYGLDRAAMGLADGVTFISRRTAVEMLGPERGVRASVVYNAVPELAMRGNRADRVELLYVGTPGHRKRTHVLPGLLERVRASIPDARLRIVGFDWDRDPRLKAEFETRGLLPTVICEGPVRSGELGRFYAAAGVLVVPSAYEGLPMVIMEARRAGLACVATDVGGTAELIRDGVNGFLVDVDDEEALAARCVALLTDSEVPMRTLQAAEESSAGLDIRNQATEYLRIYGVLGARVDAL